MSFDLVFWYESESSSVERAAQIYDYLTDGEIGVVERSPEIGEFYEEVMSIFPDLTEETAEESPWTSPLYCNAECVIANIAWSRHREVSSVLLELASKHGLTTYDPQDQIVHHAFRPGNYRG